MAACPVSLNPSTPGRRFLALSQRRLEANRRNAARSTGPRTPEGKARVARNAIKHGFFVAQERWTPQQHRDFETTLDGLRDDLQPQSSVEEGCVWTMAQSFVRMASVLRYESLAAFRQHQECDRKLNERIAAADPAEAARLRARRSKLRRAGLWKPTIPGERDAKAIIRYMGRLDRTIRGASSELQMLKSMRNGGAFSTAKAQKQTHLSALLRGGPEAAEGPRMPLPGHSKVQKQTHYSASPGGGPEAAEGPRMPPSSDPKDAKTNPLTSMFTGNRHERRRAKALAARRR